MTRIPTFNELMRRQKAAWRAELDGSTAIPEAALAGASVTAPQAEHDAGEGDTDTGADQEDMLLGSSILSGVIDIVDGVQVTLGDIVAQAHATSGLSVADWNAQSDEDREEALAATIESMRAEAGQQGIGDGGSGGHDKAAQLATKTKRELQELGQAQGVSLDPQMKKDEMIAALLKAGEN